MERFGANGAKVIRNSVDANLEDYEYLKQFKLKPNSEILQQTEQTIEAVA